MAGHFFATDFEVQLNGKKLCTAGVGDSGVLTTSLAWRGSQPYQKGGQTVAEYLTLDVGGLAISADGKDRLF